MGPRRSFLSAALLATVPLAGCSATGPPGVPVSFASDPLGPRPEGVPTVARADARAVVDDGCPKGFTDVDATVTRHPTDDGVELRCRTDHRVIPGQNVCASRGWRHGGVAVDHDWSALLPDDEVLAGVDSNAAPVDDGGPGQAAATLERDAAGGVANWRVHLTGDGRNTWTFRFVSRVGLATAPTAGDELVTVASETPVRDGWFREGAVGVETTLTHGDGVDAAGIDA